MEQMASEFPQHELFECETRRGLRQRLLLLAIILLVGLLFASCYLYDILHKPVFIPPEFEESVETGSPDEIALESGFQYFTVDQNFKVGLCTNPYIKDGQLFLYFANPADNDYWLLVLIVNSSGAEIGRSGVIKPGEYVSSVELESESIPDDVDSILVKIITYEPETYESKGTITLNPQIYTK